MHDQIDVEAGRPQGFEQVGGDPGAVGHMGQGQHRLAVLEFGPVHRPPQLQPLAADRPGGAAGEPGARAVAPAGAHPQRHAVVAGDFNGARMQHGGPQAGQLQHFVAAHRFHQLGVGHLAGIGGEHAGHIGVDLAGVGAEGGGQGHRRGVGATAAQGGDLRGAGDAAAGALEASYHHHLAVIEQAPQPVGANFEDAGPPEGGFGDDAGLGAGHGDGGHPQGLQGHRQQGDRHLLAGGQQHVHLPLGRLGADGPGQGREFVGGVAHGGHHDHQIMAVLAALGDASGHVADPFHIGH